MQCIDLHCIRTFFWQNRLMPNQKPNPAGRKSRKKLPKSELLGLFQNTFFRFSKRPEKLRLATIKSLNSGGIQRLFWPNVIQDHTSTIEQCCLLFHNRFTT